MYYCDKLPVNMYTFGSLYVPPKATAPTTIVNMTHYMFSNDKVAMRCSGLAEGDVRATWIVHADSDADPWAVHTSYPSTAPEWPAALADGGFPSCDATTPAA